MASDVDVLSTSSTQMDTFINSLCTIAFSCSSWSMVLPILKVTLDKLIKGISNNNLLILRLILQLVNIMGMKIDFGDHFPRFWLRKRLLVTIKKKCLDKKINYIWFIWLLLLEKILLTEPNFRCYLEQKLIWFC